MKLTARQRHEIGTMQVKRGEAKRIAPRFGISASWFRKLQALNATGAIQTKDRPQTEKDQERTR